MILVAGAAGFIGSHLCDYLLGNGHAVVGIDSLVTGSLNNLERAIQFREFQFHTIDITDSLPLESLSELGISHIFNLASPASPDDFSRIPEKILRVGSTGNLNLLDFAVRNRARYIFASSSEVYGEPEVHPQPESYRGSVDTMGPRSCYDEAKRFGEAAVTSYGRHFGLSYGVARIFNTYGPRMQAGDGRVISNFLHAALNSEPLVIYGTGTQTRSFCYVTDLVRGLVAVMKHKDDLVVNLGNPEEVSILSLAEMVRRYANSNSEISINPIPAGRIGDPSRRKPDISRANSLLGWKPAISLDQGLNLYLSELTT
jgi:dTDP-glucose 4,6-dehydratase